jgi:hypothetical protein
LIEGLEVRMSIECKRKIEEIFLSGMEARGRGKWRGNM